MRMQIRARSFVGNTKVGTITVAFDGKHQGQDVGIQMQFPMATGRTDAETMDAAWLRAQQILRCATLVAQPEPQIEAERHPARTVPARGLHLQPSRDLGRAVKPLIPVAGAASASADGASP